MIPSLSIHHPRQVGFGHGSAIGCVDELAAHGRTRAFLVSSRATREPAGRLASALRARGVAVEIWDEAKAEPTFESFAAARERADAFRPDAVVGIGGGSVLDVAKLVAALQGRPDSAESMVGSGVLPGRSTFLVCIPTTAGTGSEASPNSILLDSRERRKKAVISRWLVPDAVYLDPDLTASVPPALTAATGIDALAHCVEAFANRFAHPLIDLYALEGIRLIGANLARAVRDGADRDARAALLLASYYGGVCLGPVNTAAVHALAYPLGSEFHVAHGVSIALLLGAVLRFNLPAGVARYAAIARALGEPAGGSDESAAQAGIERIERLCEECRVPRHLSEVGVAIDQIPRLVGSALTITRLLKNNLRAVGPSEADGIYRAVA